MIEYEIVYVKDGVESTHEHTFNSEPTFEEITAVANSLAADEIVNYIRLN